MSRRGRNRRLRVERAQTAVEGLTTILLDSNLPNQIRITAARDLVRTAKRHNLRLPDSIRHWICKSCHAPMLPGAGARIRFSRGFRITTCKTCGHLRRLPIKDGEER